MPPTPSKTNFKSYEAQARLLRAIVAAHPEVKWNYKGIVKFYGSDMTEHALNHRFRAIRAHCDVIKEAEAKGVDCLKIPADLPKDRKDIAKFFGESTGDGIQFQFRQIKKDADSLKQTARNGGNPATALNLSGGGTSSAFSTPRKATPSKPRASGGGRSTAKKNQSMKPPPMSEEDDDEENEDVDYNALEDTPSKSRVRDRVLDGRVSKNANNGARSSTPSRAATIAAAASIAQTAAVDLTTSDSEVNTPDNEPIATHVKPAAVEKHDSSLEKPESQPVIQPDVSVYTAPSSFSQDVGGDMFSNSVADESLNLSFDNSFGHGGYYDNSGYMETHGEI